MKKGFTLAEVLITLGIIGVIAAITIPSVISSSTQAQYVSGLKKAYNTLKGVEREAKLESGDITDWAWGSTTAATDATLSSTFKPYFDILKDCGIAASGGCFATSYAPNPDGSGTTWATCNDASTTPKFVAADGIAYCFVATAGATTSVKSKGTIWVDVNGQKGPNRMGRDLFAFDVFPTVGIKPQGSYNPTDTVAVTAATTCKTNAGTNCASAVLAIGDMKY